MIKNSKIIIKKIFFQHILETFRPYSQTMNLCKHESFIQNQIIVQIEMLISFFIIYVSVT